MSEIINGADALDAALDAATEYDTRQKPEWNAAARKELARLRAALSAPHEDAHAPGCACGHAHLGDADGEDSGCCLDSCPCQKWKPSVCGTCGGDGWVYNKACTRNIKCPACGGSGKTGGTT